MFQGHLLSVRIFLIALLLLLTSPARAQETAQGAEALWTRATEEMAADKGRESVVLLERLVHDFPEAPLADDALFLAATLEEEELGDPARAATLYRELLQSYPDSRSALAAKRRLDALVRALGHGGEGARALTEFEDIIRGFPNRSEEESLARAHALLQNFPDWSENARVRIWIAETNKRQGFLSEALRAFDEVRNTEAPPKEMVQSQLGAAEVEILLGEYASAQRSIDRMQEREGLTASDQQAVAELSGLLRDSRARARLVTLCYVAIVSMLLILVFMLYRGCQSIGELARQLRSPPIEVLYMLPFAVLLTVMAFTGHEEIGPAVTIICGGSLVVTWLSGAALRSLAPLNLLRTSICGGAALIATLSLCYLALHRGQLLDLIETTVRFGPE